MECTRKNSASTCFCAAAAAITAKISKFHQIGGYPVGRGIAMFYLRSVYSACMQQPNASASKFMQC